MLTRDKTLNPLNNSSKQAVESHGGIPWVKVYTSKVDDNVSAQRPIDSISQFNNFCFTEAGLRVWKAYSVGEGKLLDPSKLGKHHLHWP